MRSPIELTTAAMVRRRKSCQSTASRGFSEQMISSSRLKQFAQSVQVLGAGVADHEIAKAVVVPGPNFKGKSRAQSLFLAHLCQFLFSENKDRNLVLPNAKNQFRARRLA